ncbi:MAG: flagellin lysine-N-methylase [Janthinobacterium lividum]
MTTRIFPQSIVKRERSSRLAPQKVLPERQAGEQPTYAGNFCCIGPQCEDTCCGGWDIPLDKITYLKYRQFPAEVLGSLVSHFVSAREGNSHDNHFCSIRRKSDGSCPFFGEDQLCGIQKHYGPGLLSATCSIYPHSLAVVDGVLEGSLSLSCPEAARVVLLQENSTQGSGDLFSGQFRTDNVFGVQENLGLEAMALQVRALVVALLRDRSRPIWQRLLMVAALCSRLDSVRDHDLFAASDLLARYRGSVGQGCSSELDRFSPSIANRLEVAIAFSNQRCQEKDCGRRFQEVFWDFIEGIGSADSQGADDDVHRFREANMSHLEPLLSKSPFIMENYLLNYVYQHLFPFGRAGSDRFVAHTMAEEAVLLIVQYSWMTTLLTGVAGRYGPEFGKAQIIITVQSFTRAVEHTPYILGEVLAFVRSRNLDTLSGLAKLLRT